MMSAGNAGEGRTEEQAWAIWHHRFGLFLWTVRDTRRDAIAAFNANYDARDSYARARRGGSVKAVRCTLTTETP